MAIAMALEGGHLTHKQLPFVDGLNIGPIKMVMTWGILGLPHLRGLSQVFLGLKHLELPFFRVENLLADQSFFSFLFGLILFFWGDET